MKKFLPWIFIFLGIALLLAAIYLWLAPTAQNETGKLLKTFGAILSFLLGAGTSLRGWLDVFKKGEGSTNITTGHGTQVAMNHSRSVRAETYIEQQIVQSNDRPEGPGIFSDVSVLNEDTAAWKRGDDTILRYTLDRSEQRILIESNLGYARTFQAGGPITPLNYISPTGCAFRWDFPILDFKVVNNGSTTLFLSEVVFDIEESRPDQRPFFAIRRDTHQRQAGDLLLINEGWCDLTDLVISFNLVPGEVAAPNYETPYSHSVTLPVLADHAEVEVAQAFEEEGADIEGLILLQNGEWESRDVFVAPRADGSQERITALEYDDRYKKCLGPFQNAAGTLAGEISFARAEEPGRRDHVKFQAVVYLENRNRLGLPRPPTYAYGTAFDAKNAAYQRRVQISHEIKPGETDRFTMKIGVPASSFHRFRTTIRDVSGLTLQLLPIELNCFVPRHRRDAIALAISPPPPG